MSAILLLLNACCKNKMECVNGIINVSPFVERYSKFECQNNMEYTFIFSNKSQIDSLFPTCSFNSPIAFPIDESNMKYFLVGRLSYHQKDTFQTVLLKDTCNKSITYQVDMIQRNTSLWQFPGVISMFCAVENIPADYKVEVKYKYVPLP